MVLRCRFPRGAVFLGRPCLAQLPQPEGKPDGGQPRDAGEEEDEPVLARQKLEQKKRHQDADQGAAGIHHAVETEGPASDFAIHGVRDHGVAGRGAQSFSQPVHGASEEDHRPGEGQGHERLGQGRQAVSGPNVGNALACLVAVPAREAFHDTDDGFGHALDEAKDRNGSAQRRSQEQRDHRVDHLRGEVGEEADPTQVADRFGELVWHMESPCLGGQQKTHAEWRGLNETVLPPVSGSRSHQQVVRFKGDSIPWALLAFSFCLSSGGLSTPGAPWLRVDPPLPYP